MTGLHNNMDWLPPLRKPRKAKVKKVVSSTWKVRYEKSYQANYQREYPQAYKDHGYINTTFPDVRKANGLTQAIVKFLLWEGHRATRVASSGRIIEGKYIPGTTHKGAADISATVKGRSVMLEIKIGSDRASEYQLREQQLERKAGGCYEFIRTMEEFFLWYDGFILSLGTNR